MASLKQARIVGATVEVLCPHCDEAQPSPDTGGVRACAACDERFQINFQGRVSVTV